MTAVSDGESLQRFHNPVKLTSGVKALDHLPVELGCHDAMRPMVLLHRGPGARGRLRRLLKSFRDSGITLVVYDRLSSTTGLEEMQALAGHFRRSGCDALLALGRGPLLHQAKALRLFAEAAAAEDTAAAEGSAPPGEGAAEEAGPAADAADGFGPALLSRLPRRPIPLFWLPTGPGAGDELGGTVRLSGKRLQDPRLRPQLACADKRLLDPSDRQQLLDSVLVALTNAVEVCLDSGDNPFAATYAEAAVKALKVTLTPQGLEERRSDLLLSLTNAALWADAARRMGAAGLAHRLGRALSGRVDSTAGVCMALCLPAVVDRALGRAPRLSAELLYLLGDAELYSLTTPELRRPRCVNLLREAWHTLYENWPDELPGGLAETGISPEALPEVARSAHPADPLAAQEVLEQSWTLVAPYRLQALPLDPATTTATAPTGSDAADRQPTQTAPQGDEGAPDAPAELL